MATDIKPTPLKKGDRVVAAEPLRRVPEGTPGKLKIVDGLGPWIRAWVQFDNGEWLGSVGITKLARENDWDAFQERRAAEAELAAERAAQALAAPVQAAPVEAAPGGAAVSAEASRVPAALLARSAAARAKAAAAAAAAEG